MTRFACWTLALVALWPGNSEAAAEKKPHIVFILADDLGPGDLGCYGGKIAKTPNIDRLASGGVRFTQYYASAPICSPSRCGLITGNFPARWKLTSYLQTRTGNRGCEQADFLDPEAPSLPRLLKAMGYRTAHFGKWHLGGGRDVKSAPKFAAYGYDEHAGTWESPEPDPEITAGNWIWSDKDKVKRWDRTAYFVERTLAFLKRNAAAPCFVNLWLDDPHTPWVPGPAPRKAQAGPTCKQSWTRMTARSASCSMGSRELGIEKNTLVIFVSDNGPLPTFDQERTRGLRGCKLSLYEGGVRLPCIVHWPGKVPAGRTDDTTVLAGTDFLPTLIAVNGGKLSDLRKLDGEDRSRAFFGAPLPTRARPLFWEYGRNQKFFSYPAGKNRSPNLAMREGNWKFLVNDDGTSAELYDLSTDPNETQNVVALQKEVTARMKNMLLEWRKSLP